MPTYQYACTACGHRFEAVQSFSDSTLTECPECTGRLRKVFSSVGIVFKGSGFYRTDSRAGAVDAVATNSSESSGSSNESSGSGGSKDKSDSSGSSSKTADSGSSGSPSKSSSDSSSKSSGTTTATKTS